jgi:hypothetical protein
LRDVRFSRRWKLKLRTFELWRRFGGRCGNLPHHMESQTQKTSTWIVILFFPSFLSYFVFSKIHVVVNSPLQCRCFQTDPISSSK